ncbi:phage Gp37/Gp68 family protein [Methylobacterium nodulans]|uniref:Gp37Gp68 family protein n=1 Tax=Methylobacterium nodulans (strain LMG 21967 / CNCM I-2342 / ORS 2060) TaxID=460265 RepID=B8IV39_METNO|nr:phage Gp37/Gp68 family protein [Methylobacterium nodulans]ACL59097.1 Gp37Gp68 family protein [Methylobacterium nodulans ORS 2060]
MAENTKIEWCHHTFNPWVGCTRLSPACDHCYAEAWAKRTGQAHLWTGERRRTSASNWQQPLKWDRAAAAAGERHRVFCASLADFFDNQVPSRWRDDAWHLISQTPQLDWMLLTKRPQNIAKMLPGPATGAPAWGEGWPNVWLGTTIEDRARLRNPDALRTVPARVRFLSCEPLLEDLGEIDLTGIHLVIVGGESGPGARPMRAEWARSIRDQCIAAGVAYHFKQHGDWIDVDQLRHLDGWTGGPGFGRFDHCRYDQDAECLRIGKAAAGRLLDGRTWDEMPEVRHA